jgi:type II secretion system protein N
MAAGVSERIRAPRRLPRGLVTIALLLFSLALVVVFALLLFPYDRFRGIAAAELGRATGASVSMDELGGGLSIGGPRLVATNLLLRWPDRKDLLLERARVRPAWSLSWLRGDPAIHLDVAGPVGSIAGTTTRVPGLNFEGRAREVDLSLLPVDHLADPLPVLGRLDAEIDLRPGPNGPIGEIRFESRDGSVALPQFPFAFPFEEAHGELERSESGAFAVREFAVSGPMFELVVEGSVAASRRVEEAGLDLEVDLVVVDANLREMVQPFGIQLDPKGAGQFRLEGTVSRPVIR